MRGSTMHFGYLLASALLLLGATSARAALTAEMNTFWGPDRSATASFEQVGDDIEVTLTVDLEDFFLKNGAWTAFWFNISNDDLLTGLSVVGDDIEAYDFSGDVNTVGSSVNNLDAPNSPGTMEAGIAFSTDRDIEIPDAVTFTLSHPDGLSLSLFENELVAGRLMGMDNCCCPCYAYPSGLTGILENDGDPDIPEPASFALMGLGAAALIRRR